MLLGASTLFILMDSKGLFDIPLKTNLFRKSFRNLSESHVEVMNPLDEDDVMKNITPFLRVSALALAVSISCAVTANDTVQVQGSEVNVVKLEAADVQEKPRVVIPERMASLFVELADARENFKQAFQQLDSLEHEAGRINDVATVVEQLRLKEQLAAQQEQKLYEIKEALSALLKGPFKQWRIDTELAFSKTFHGVIDEATDLAELEQQLMRIAKASKDKVLSQDQLLALAKLVSDKDSLLNSVKTKVTRAKVHQAQLAEIGNHFANAEYYRNEADLESYKKSNAARVFREYRETALEIANYGNTKSIQTLLDADLPQLTDMDITGSAPIFEHSSGETIVGKSLNVSIPQTSDGGTLLQILRGMKAEVDVIDRRHLAKKG